MVVLPLALRRSGALGAIALALLVAGCESSRFARDGGGGRAGDTVASAPTGAVTSQPLGAPGQSGGPPGGARPAVAVPQVGGPWTLSSATGGACIVTIGQNSADPQGTVQPAGGCPGNFFTTRRWAFGANGLELRNHRDEVLAQLSEVGPGRFEGTATAGDGVVLQR